MVGAQMMYRVFCEESPPTTIKPKQLVGGEKMHIILVYIWLVQGRLLHDVAV